MYNLRDTNDSGAVAARASDGGKYNLVEGENYWFRICLEDTVGGSLTLAFVVCAVPS